MENFYGTSEIAAFATRRWSVRRKCRTLLSVMVLPL